MQFTVLPLFITAFSSNIYIYPSLEDKFLGYFASLPSDLHSRQDTGSSRLLNGIAAVCLLFLSIAIEIAGSPRLDLALIGFVTDV